MGGEADGGGVVVEVPVMLSVCNVCNRTRGSFGGAAMARV